MTQAAVINGLFVPGVNQLEDTDVERVVSANGTVKTSGNFVVGDTIQSILRFTTANTDLIGDIIGPPYQLNVYAELQVAAITNCGPTLLGTACTLIFAPTGNLGAGVIADIYERTNGGQGAFSQVLAPATAIANVQSETLVAQLGVGQATDYWFTSTLLDVGAASSLTAASPQAANGAFGLSVISDPGGLGILPNTMLGVDGNLHSVIGNGSAYQLAPTANAGWLVSSNTTAQFSIPEPGTLLLLGAAVFGMGFARRRQQAS